MSNKNVKNIVPKKSEKILPSFKYSQNNLAIKNEKIKTYPYFNFIF